MLDTGAGSVCPLCCGTREPVVALAPVAQPPLTRGGCDVDGSNSNGAALSALVALSCLGDSSGQPGSTNRTRSAAARAAAIAEGAGDGGRGPTRGGGRALEESSLDGALAVRSIVPGGAGAGGATATRGRSSRPPCSSVEDQWTLLGGSLASSRVCLTESALRCRTCAGPDRSGPWREIPGTRRLLRRRRNRFHRAGATEAAAVMVSRAL